MENISTVSFSVEEQYALYKAIYNRRDVRGQFKSEAIPVEVLARILQAAHHAPSVGFMQPWNFLVIDSPSVKSKVYEIFNDAYQEESMQFSEERQQQYRQLKLAGIQEAPINVCITCDRSRMGVTGLGRTHNPQMDLYSCVCAVQNLWLAARVEGVGVGWVSIYKEVELKKILGIPDGIVPIAYLCLGYVDFFYDTPELEVKRWQSRLALENLIAFNQWEATMPDHPLIESINNIAARKF